MLPSKHSLRREPQFYTHYRPMRKVFLISIAVIAVCIFVLFVTSTTDGKEDAPKHLNENIELGTAMQSKQTHAMAPLDPLAVSLESLSIVSMNLAGCQPSKSAPWDWNQQMSTDAVRTELLKSNPDIIALQECPGGVNWAQRVFGDNYNVMGATFSHADQVVLLVKAGIQAQAVPLQDLPAIMAELQFADNRRLLIASIHLAPFERGNYERRAEVESLLQKAMAKSIPFLFAGDTNMRASEDDVMEGDLHLVDIWKLAGSNPATKFTWDTIDHRKDGLFFNQYYGDNTRQYSARYDRIYAYTADSSIVVETPPAFELIGNQPQTSKIDFLSDHFGMSSHINLKWNV